MRLKDLKTVAWIGLLIFALASAAWPQNPLILKSGKKSAASKNVENLSLPQHLSAENVDHILAGLSDEQVRRLLIDELRAQAQREAQATAGQPKPEGIAGFIEKIKNLTALLQTRIEALRSGDSATPQEISGVFAFLGKGERGTKTVTGVILSVAAGPAVPHPQRSLVITLAAAQDSQAVAIVQ